MTTEATMGDALLYYRTTGSQDLLNRLMGHYQPLAEYVLARSDRPTSLLPVAMSGLRQAIDTYKFVGPFESHALRCIRAALVTAELRKGIR